MIKYVIKKIEDRIESSKKKQFEFKKEDEKCCENCKHEKQCNQKTMRNIINTKWVKITYCSNYKKVIK